MSRMKILVVTNLFHPDRGGGASVFSDLCYGLVEAGHQVTVYTTYPYYPEWKNKSGARAWRVQQESINGVEVHRYGLYIPRNPSKLIPRIAYELSFAVSLMRSLFRRRQFDAVMVYCPLAGAVAYAAVRKMLFHEPLWLNVQDIPADAASASGISKSGWFNRLGEATQLWLFNRADVWSTIAPSMVRRLETIRKRGQPIHYCPNFLNATMEREIDERASKVGRPMTQPLRLLYAGNIGKKQGLLDFCRALSETPLEFHFRIQGNGGEAGSVKNWVETIGDRRFQFGDFLNEENFVKALFETDMFVITEKAGVGASFIPSKLIPCIATGTPLLCLCDREGPLGTEVEQHNLGLCLPWTEIHGLASGLRELRDDGSKFTSIQQNAVDRSRFYTRTAVIGSIERELKNLSGCRDDRPT
jgi:colanic acid biosynthesis glycosyl transferase WcaI